MKPSLAISAVISCLLLSGQSWAAGHTCDQVVADMFGIDGMLDDWSELRPHQTGGADGGFELRCAYDDSNFYISINIRDGAIRRTGRSQDNLIVELSVGPTGKPATLQLFPGYKGEKPKRKWLGGKVPKWLEVEDTNQSKGWSMEAAIPLKRLAGWGPHSPALCARVVYSDADWDGDKPSVTAFKGTLHLSAGRAAVRGFMKAARLSRRDIRVDVLADVNGSPGVERIIAGGSVIGVVTDTFAYMTLPVSGSEDVIAVKVVDLAGVGTSAIIAHYRQRGNGGAREVVAAWYESAGGFEQVLAFEVRKQLGDLVLANKWYLAPRGKYRKGKTKKSGHDIVVEATTARGWDEDNFEEIPAADVKPILLPWEDQTSAVYYFEGNSVFGGDAKVGR